jgi:hypothetical protein
MRLSESWVKAPFLRNCSLLLVGECVRKIYPVIYKRLSKGSVVLSSCPESESPGHGKISSILRCSSPRRISVLTIDGSPHCLTLHAAVNQALFITEARIPSKHFVIHDGKLIEIEPEAVRVGRYLHLVQECARRSPDVVQKLNEASLEQASATKLAGKCS